MIRGLCLACGLLVLSSTALGAVQSALPDSVVTGASSPPGGSSAILGTVVDAVSESPVAGVEVRVSGSGRSALSRRDGSFRLDGLPAGEYTVTTSRAGYAPSEARVQVGPEGAHLLIGLTPSAIQLPGVVVTATGEARGVDDVYHSTSVVDGSNLRRRLSSSVAATLEGEPGLAQRYNGPAAAQPVVRGLSGDRVLVLEDGSRTGDIATTGADHAVTIDPLTAERIEVVRGPAGVLYGSNALGGVINVIREEVPRSHPGRVTGMLRVQGESVNDGLVGGGAITAPVGSFLLRGELSGRRAGDTNTPLGTLPATQIETYNAAGGVGRVFDRGYAGTAARHHVMNYGVPGVFQGDTIPGAHAGGVRIELRRSTVRLETGLSPNGGPFSSIEAKANYVRFEQDEIESGGIVGTRFAQILGTGDLVARHERELNGIELRGAAGIWVLGKDFRAAGSNTGSRPAEQIAAAGYAFEEIGFGELRLQAGGRYDWSRITPLDTRPSSLLQNVRERSFGAFSGSVAVLYDIGGSVSLGASLARAFRTPAIEELYSNGPHLADFSFDIGNPDLEAEHGLGTELFARANRPGLSASVAVYRNAITRYIYHEPTGELDPRLRLYPVYRAEQANARFHGAEGALQWEVLRGLVAHGQASYVRAARRDTGEPLPAIPPFQTGMGIRYDDSSYFLGLDWTANARQGRIGEFEEPTDGHHLFGADAGMRWALWNGFHTVTLRIDNLTDAVWRSHISRIKAVAPQPGRNIKLLYSVSF